MKQIYDKKCSWCYFDNGKREKVNDVYVLSYYPYKVIFRTRSGVYLYDGTGLNKGLNVIEEFSWSYYFYFLGKDNKPLKDYTLQNKIVESHIKKVQFTDKDIPIFRYYMEERNGTDP